MKVSLQNDRSGIINKDAFDIFAGRRDKLRKKIIEKGLDLLIVSIAVNRFYLSGFELHDPQPNESSGLLMVCADGEDWLLTDSRYSLAAEKIWPRERIFVYKKQIDGLAECLFQHANLAGVETASLSLEYMGRLREKLGRRVFLQPCNGLVEKLREIKDNAEIAALRNSFKLNHQMFQWLDQEKDNLPGKIEKNLAWEIERLFRDRGAQELAFSTIVAAGTKSAEPHAIPDNMVIKENLPLLVDAGCRVDNYCSDQTRTWWLGATPSKEFDRAMDLVRKAQDAAMAIMRPGVSCETVYNAAKEVFANAGVADAFTHGLGHGVGLETHEAPRLSKGSRDVLEKDMVVTVEPGLYYPEWGGIRWEYTVLVNEDGVEIL